MFFQGSEVSTSMLNGSQTHSELQVELSKANAELDATIHEQKKLRDNIATKERTLNETLNKKNDEISTLKLETDRLKNKVIF